MDEQIEATPKHRDFVKEIDNEVYKKWDQIIARDKKKVRHLSILKKLPGLNGVAVNQAINWHLATDRVKELIDNYFKSVE